MQRLIGRTILHYQVLEQIGQGGMGVVYKAEDTRLQRTVAIKFLPREIAANSEEHERFQIEARAAAALNHPNIATIYTIEKLESKGDGSEAFIVMEYVAGNELKKRIATGPLPPNFAIKIALQLARGLQAAHEKGVIHRDIKSANIMLAESGQVKIMDFGLAKIGGGAQITKGGTTVGTAAYMSPEQARGEPADKRADIWSFGVVLYEMLTGKLPFKGDYEQAIIYAILCKEPVEEELPVSLEKVIKKCLHKNPAERYGSAEELLDHLGQIEQAVDTNGPTAGLAKRSAGHSRKWWIGAGLAVLILVSIWFAQLELSEDRTGPAANENSIAVMYFDNLTGDPSLDWIEAGMVEMLTVNLARFETLNVLSSQRLFDIMRQVSDGEAVRIERSTATQIASIARVQTMLLGSVLGTSERLRLNTQLVEVPTGRIIGSEVLDTDIKNSLFSAVDSLTLRIAHHLDVVTADRSQQANVAYSLTNSPEALRHYVEGIQEMYHSNYANAISHFSRATNTDSTFAMAYYHRSLAIGWHTGERDQEALKTALKYSDRVSERERLLIEATMLLYEDTRERKEAFEQIVERYPDEKLGWYELGETYYHGYWPRKSVTAFRRATELDPHFLLAYFHMLDFYFHTSQYQEARTLNAKVLELDPSNSDFYLDQAYLKFITNNNGRTRQDFLNGLRQVIADSAVGSVARLDAGTSLALIEKNLDRMETLYSSFREERFDWDAAYLDATHSLAGLSLLRGQYQNAEVYLRQARQRRPDSISRLYEEGQFWLIRGATNSARKNAQRIIELHTDGTEPWPEIASMGQHLLFLTALSENQLDDSQQIISELKHLAVNRENENACLYYDALGRLACHRGDLEKAKQYFTQALSKASAPYKDISISFGKLILDGLLACLEKEGASESLVQTAAEASPFIFHAHELNVSAAIVWNRALLRKARAYEALGQTPEAISTYEEFLNNWNEADEELPDVIDAKARLAKLRGVSQ